MGTIKVDFMRGVIIVSKDYYNKAMTYGTDEYVELKVVQEENPNMRIVFNESSRRRRNNTKGMSYRYMRNFISILDSENLVNFEKVISYYERMYGDSVKVYQYVKEWFLEYYPRHKDMVVDNVPHSIEQMVANF